MRTTLPEDTTVESLAPAQPAASTPTGKWRLSWGAVATALLLFAGVCLLLYPHAAAWVTQYYQSRVVVDVAQRLPRAGEASNLEHLAEANAYNKQLVGGAFLNANGRKPTAEPFEIEGFEYDSLLKATPDGVMGRLRIPTIAVDLPIYHGTEDATLLKGVGHLEGTSLPVGGTTQHSVLTAHRGLPEATMFDNLDRLEPGDTFTVEVYGEVLTYQITDRRTVAPKDTDTLRAVAGEDLVTLVTCTPLGINTHRILVTGERILPTPQADLDRAGEAPNIPGFPWWAVGLAAALAAATTYVWGTGRPPQQPKLLKRPKHAAR